MAPRRTCLRAFGYRSSVSPNKGLPLAPLECDLVTNETAFTVPISRLDEPACGLRHDPPFAGDFQFNQIPITTNASNMPIADGAIGYLQRVPLEVNRRGGQRRALRAVPTIGNRPRGHGARNQACMSLERLKRARLCPPYKRDPVSSGPAVVPPQEPQELQNIAHQGAAVGGLGTGS